MVEAGFVAVTPLTLVTFLFLSITYRPTGLATISLLPEPSPKSDLKVVAFLIQNENRFVVCVVCRSPNSATKSFPEYESTSISSTTRVFTFGTTFVFIYWFPVLSIYSTRVNPCGSIQSLLYALVRRVVVLQAYRQQSRRRIDDTSPIRGGLSARLRTRWISPPRRPASQRRCPSVEPAPARC